MPPEKQEWSFNMPEQDQKLAQAANEAKAMQASQPTAGKSGAQRPNRRPAPAARNAVAEEKQFDERTLNIDRVARVIKGGRRFRFRALVVVGDRKNRVGIGSSKGADVTSAITKASEVAKKHMIKVALHKGTLPHEAQAKVGGASILVKPASAGTGLIAGGAVRTILEVAGVRDALSKSLGSTNKTNTAYATIAALQSIVPAKDWVTKPAVSKKAAAKKTPAKKESK